MTLYQILGSPANASFERLAQGYRTSTFNALATYHINHEHLYAISDAFQTLTNSQLRENYLQIGDHVFDDVSYGKTFVDAVDFLLDSFGVRSLPFVNFSAFNVILSCLNEKEIKKIAKIQLKIPEHTLSRMRRPEWRKRKNVNPLGCSPAYYRCQSEKISHLMKAYQTLGGNHVISIITPSFQTSLGQDWINCLGCIFIHQGKAHKSKSQNGGINFRARQKSMVHKAKLSQEYIRRAMKLWRKGRICYDDEINFFYLFCILQLFVVAEKSINYTLNFMFKEIQERYQRERPARILVEIGELMYGFDGEIRSDYDCVLADTLTVTSYHVLYEILETKKRNLSRLTYTYPVGVRHQTIVKMMQDAEDLNASSTGEASHEAPPCMAGGI